MARTTALLGQALIYAGDIDRAVAMLERALEGVDDPVNDPSAVNVMGAPTLAHMFREDATETVRWADKTLASAERLNLLPLIVDSLVHLGIGVHDAGRPREGIALLRGALSLAKEADVPAGHQLRGLLNLSDVVGRVDPSAARTQAVEALTLARRLGMRAVEVFATVNHFMSALSTGDWSEARRELDETRGDDLQGHERVGVEVGLSMADALAGDVAAAEKRLEGLKVPLPAVGQQSTDLFELGRGVTCWVRGDFVGALRATHRVSATSLQATLCRTIGMRALLWMRDRGGLSSELSD